MSAVAAPRWTGEEFEAQRKTAIELFRVERMQEPLKVYLDAFDSYRVSVMRLLEATADFRQLTDAAAQVLGDDDLLEALRYSAGPPISEDDLKELAETSLAPSRLRSDPEAARRVIDTVRRGLDPRRFGWVAERRAPTETEREAAVTASAALMASQRVRTVRANLSKDRQEDAVKERLARMGLAEVAARTINAHAEAPKPGEFCGESLLGTRKADIVVGLFDHRIMPIECKVSNSSTNSVKRLNNDAAAKAGTWITEFGNQGIVPTAVLSGVFKNHNLRLAQDAGLVIFWAHDLDQLAGFVDLTRGTP